LFLLQMPSTCAWPLLAAVAATAQDLGVLAAAVGVLHRSLCQLQQ
jgi:alkanesulfonate monooxygenase SsuD/methylene tetrahydromethanopterin reductase-like flavin-dependent oxidoreductase (luciferase family)